MLIVRRPRAHAVSIHSNGAVDLSRSRCEPVFQRSNYWRLLDSHQIYVCDPATTGAKALSLAWGQATLDHWCLPEISHALRAISRALDVPEPHRHLYIGSSAGGFLSLALSAFDPGSRSLVNNPQIDWTYWIPDAVNAVRHTYFNGKVPANIRRDHPTRTNALNTLAEYGSANEVTCHINVASILDAQKQLPLAQEATERANPSRYSVVLHTYSDPGRGHNPLAVEDFFRMVNDANS